MPYLPDGSWIDDEQYAEMIARTGGTGIPTSGTVLGTNYNFMPTTSGGGALNLGWDQTPGFGAAINFDPSAGIENAFISDYDVSGQGMANIGTGLSDSRLGLTAGLQGTGLNRPNAYVDATISDVVPGLTVGAGTNTTPFASYFGDESSKIPGLGITKTSGGPTDVSYATEVVPGVDFNIGTAGGGNVGVKASGAWEDIGKTFRQLFSPISKAGAADVVPAVGTQPLGKYGPRGYTGAGMADVSPVPSVPVAQPIGKYGPSGYTGPGVPAELSYEMQYPGLYGDNLPESGGVHDAIEHIDAIYGGVTTTSKEDEGLRTRWKDTVVPLLGLLPGDSGNTVIEKIMSTGLPGTGFTGDAIETAKSAESIKDVLNNMVIMDAKKSGVAKDDLVHSVLTGVNPLIQTNQNINVTAQQRALDSLIGKPVGTPIPEEAILSPLYAAADLVSRGGKLDADDARQMAFQVDEFVDLSTQPTQTVTRPSRVAPDISGPTHVPAQPALPAYSGPTAAERKAQSDAQRKQAMADKKAAADAQKRFNELAAKATQEAAAQAQAASQAQAAQAQAQAYIDFASGRDRGVDQRQLAAAREVLSQIDTFDSGNPFAESEAQDRASVAIDASRRGGGPF